ncbi:unnamed protein product [Miscanthus lutarioriparius]|uniref:Uncharacterized protein n=1 Tax=Miscanthus lutarioriparius TaxID=422564 RepID=A0A811QXD0_9POAL|nr:unnamed protein product [Miscanthus lutarioriparius]
MGSQLSGRITSGMVASAEVNGLLPFRHPNINILPTAMPLPQRASNLINSNNVPYVAGLGNTSSVVIQNSGNLVNGSINIPFVNARDLLLGVTLQNLHFRAHQFRLQQHSSALGQARAPASRALGEP